LDDEVLDLLAERNAALCIYDPDGYQSPKTVTADFVYVRLHGPGPAYRGCYSVQILAGWAGAFSGWSRPGYRVYCYFDNAASGHAVRSALQLQAMLHKRG